MFNNTFQSYFPVVKWIKIRGNVKCYELSLFRKQTNDMVVAAVTLLNSHIQDFDPVKVCIH